MQAYRREGGCLGWRSAKRRSVLFTVQPGGRRVPYRRPHSTPLYTERLSLLCRNRTSILACPQRSRPRPTPREASASSALDETVVVGQSDVLSALPRPDRTGSWPRVASHVVTDIDFPADLEQSFNTGALNSTFSSSTTTTMIAHTPGNLHPSDTSSSFSLHNYNQLSQLRQPATVQETSRHRSSNLMPSHLQAPVVPDSSGLHVQDPHADSIAVSEYSTELNQFYTIATDSGDGDGGRTSNCAGLEVCEQRQDLQLPVLFYPTPKRGTS